METTDSTPTCSRRRVTSRRLKTERRGQVAVEFAMVAPIIFLFVFAAIEFGRALLAIHCMEGAAHDACRLGIIESATTEDVEDMCAARLAAGGIIEYDMTLTPVSLATAQQWDPVTVNVTTTYGDISWLPVPTYLGDITLSATCTLPREAETAE